MAEALNAPATPPAAMAVPTAASIQAALTREPAKRELYLAALAFADKQPERVGRFALEAVIDEQAVNEREALLDFVREQLL